MKCEVHKATISKFAIHFHRAYNGSVVPSRKLVFYMSPSLNQPPNFLRNVVDSSQIFTNIRQVTADLVEVKEKGGKRTRVSILIPF